MFSRLSAESVLPLPRMAMAAKAGRASMQTPKVAWRVDDLNPAAWDAFAAQFDDVSFDQCALYTEHQWPARTNRIQVFENGLPIGGAVIVVVTPPLLKSGLAYVKAGPFWRQRGTVLDIGRYETVIGAVVEEFARRRGHHLTVLPRATPGFAALEENALERLGFAMLRPMTDPNRYLVRTTLSEDGQLKSMAQKWRYNLRKSWKNKFEIVKGDSLDEIATFRALHARMRGRKRLGAHEPVGLIPDLVAQLPSALRPTIYLTYHEGKPVSGAVITHHGDTSYYVFGATADEALPLKAGYALQWAIIRDLRDTRVQWYDLGGEANSQGLLQFKKGLVGREGEIVSMTGEFEYSGSVSGTSVSKLLFAARAAKRFVKERSK